MWGRNRTDVVLQIAIEILNFNHFYLSNLVFNFVLTVLLPHYIHFTILFTIIDFLCSLYSPCCIICTLCHAQHITLVLQPSVVNGVLILQLLEQSEKLNYPHHEQNEWLLDRLDNEISEASENPARSRL